MCLLSTNENLNNRIGGTWLNNNMILKFLCLPHKISGVLWGMDTKKFKDLQKTRFEVYYICNYGVL